MRVLFRKFNDDNSVIALFPDDICDMQGNITSYMHVGQHSAASPELINSAELTPASPIEYKELLRELTEVCGYENLHIVTGECRWCTEHNCFEEK